MSKPDENAFAGITQNKKSIFSNPEMRLKPSFSLTKVSNAEQKRCWGSGASKRLGEPNRRLCQENECVSRNHELAVMSYKVDDYWPPIFTVVNYVNPLSWIFWVEESISSKQRNAPDKNLMCILPGKLSCSRDLL